FGEGQLGGRGDALDEDPLALDLAPDVLGLDLEAAEDLPDRLIPLAQDAEQDVLGLDDTAAQLARLVAGEEQGTAGLLVVLLKHSLQPQGCTRRPLHPADEIGTECSVCRLQRTAFYHSVPPRRP